MRIDVVHLVIDHSYYSFFGHLHYHIRCLINWKPIHLRWISEKPIKGWLWMTSVNRITSPSKYIHRYWGWDSQVKDSWRDRAVHGVPCFRNTTKRVIEPLANSSQFLEKQRYRQINWREMRLHRNNILNSIVDVIYWIRKLMTADFDCWDWRNYESRR